VKEKTEAKIENGDGSCTHFFSAKKAVALLTDEGDTNTVTEVYCQKCLEVRPI